MKYYKIQCKDERTILAVPCLDLLPKLCELFVGKELWEENENNQKKKFNGIFDAIVTLFVAMGNPRSPKLRDGAQKAIENLINVVANAFEKNNTQFIHGLLCFFFFVCVSDVCFFFGGFFCMFCRIFFLLGGFGLFQTKKKN